MRRAAQLGWPEGLAVLLGLSVIRWPELHRAAAPFLRVYPYVVLGLGLLLGWRFGRGRLFYGLVAVALADRALASMATPGEVLGDAGRTVGVLVAVLLPANFGILGFLPEAGPFTRFGRWWSGVLVAQIVAVALAGGLAGPGTAWALELPLFPVALERWLSLPQFPLLAFLTAGTLLGVRAVRARDPTARGLFWATAAAFVALNASVPSNRTLYLATAGLALVVTMVEASHALTFQDQLTGLPGRRAFDQALTRLGGTFVVAMVDVDHFKQFNDDHGHAVGDQVLKLVARSLAEVGGDGKGFRYGGEEFAVLFPGMSLEGAVPHLEALRERIAATTFTLRGVDRPKDTPARPERGRGARRRDLSVTVSIGAAAARPRDAEPSAVVGAADQALYRAKEAGRNRVATGR